MAATLVRPPFTFPPQAPRLVAAVVPGPQSAPGPGDDVFAPIGEPRDEAAPQRASLGPFRNSPASARMGTAARPSADVRLGAPIRPSGLVGMAVPQSQINWLAFRTDQFGGTSKIAGSLKEARDFVQAAVGPVLLREEPYTMADGTHCLRYWLTQTGPH